ncbi:MAG: molecular chaperone TorD family protein [Eggerthellaceae bacterium]|nr:molecular chaperone TorD family protein [Eggerthellaceae bacterium]
MGNDEKIFSARLYQLMAQMLRYPTDVRELEEGARALQGLFAEGSEEHALCSRMLEALHGGAKAAGEAGAADNVAGAATDQTDPADPDVLQALQVDYTALFIGSFKMWAPPYASYYLDGEGQLGGETTGRVERAYREGGRALSQERKQPGDHAAVMCEFLFDLLRRSAQAAEAGRAEEAAALEARAASFHATYLASWMHPFARLICDHAGTSFYRALGELVPLAVVEDALFPTKE